jgi:hypothetical protein
MKGTAILILLLILIFTSCKKKEIDSPDIVDPPSASIQVTSPNGGEMWGAGAQKEIRWFSSGIDSVRLEYTTDNGSSWKAIGTDRVNSGVYCWNPVPNTPSALAKIRIMNAKNRTPEDASDNVFSILPTAKLAIIAPGGGESWQSGSSQQIRWSSENVSYVKIQYTTNFGVNWNTITESEPNTGVYIWENLPQLHSNYCKVRILDTRDNCAAAESNSVFTITNQVLKSIEIETPNGGEKYSPGTQAKIKWNSVNVQFVNIEITFNSCNSWNIAAERVQNNNTYDWLVPGTPSSLCLFKITDSDDPAVSDMSDAVFTITAQRRIKVTNPCGLDTVAVGEPVVISWESAGVDYVRIQYSISANDAERNWIDIVQRVQNDRMYTAVFTECSEYYKIRVSDADDPLLYDDSDLPFSVVK